MSAYSLKYGLRAPRDARQDLLGDRAIRIEEHVQRQVVERGIDLIDDIVVEGVACDDAGLRQTCLEQTLTQRTDKASTSCPTLKARRWI